MLFGKMVSHCCHLVILGPRAWGGLACAPSIAFMNPCLDICPFRYNVVDKVREMHTDEEGLRKLQGLHRVRHLLQFSLNPMHELLRLDQVSGRSCRPRWLATFGIQCLKIDVRWMAWRELAMTASRSTPAGTSP